MLGQKNSEHAVLNPGGPPPSTPEIPMLMQHLEDAISEAESVVSVIHRALDRLHGPVPTESPAAELTKGVPEVATFALEYYVARLGIVLMELRSARDRLNSVV